MAQWTYRCYDRGREPNLWAQWYDDHPEAQGVHDQVFDLLEDQVRWSMPLARHLKDDLIEIRLLGPVQWRVFGCYGGKRCFVVLAIGNHKDKVYSPPDIMKTARKRLAKFKRDEDHAKFCKRPEED